MPRYSQGLFSPCIEGVLGHLLDCGVIGGYLVGLYVSIASLRQAIHRIGGNGTLTSRCVGQ